MAKHSKILLTKNSFHIGQRCPISHRTLRVGDEVIVCEQTQTIFALGAWQQILPSWDYTCKFCETSVDRWEKTVAPSVTANTLVKQQKIKTPVYDSSRGSSLRALSQFIGVAVILFLVAVVAYGLGRNTLQPSVQSATQNLQQTPIASTIQTVPQVKATDTILPSPTTLPVEEQVIGETATPQPTSTFTPLSTSSQTPTIARQPTHTSTPTLDQLKTIASNKVRSSRVYVAYPQQTDNFLNSLLQHLSEFQLPSLGITEQVMREVLSRPDVGDRVNGLVQEVWAEWTGIAESKGFEPMSTDPGNQGLSPLRQLVIRMIQGKQGRLVDSQQHALHNILTRSENPSIWGRDMDSVIGAVNRESFLWP